MTCVHGPPTVAQVDLVPGTEVARAAVGHADIAKVASDITGRNVERPGECDGQMLEVAAHAYPFGKDVERRFGWPGSQVVELNMIVYPITDSNGSLPSLWSRSEELAGDGRHPVDFAIAAVQQKLQNFVRQVLDGVLKRIRSIDYPIFLIPDQTAPCESKRSCRSAESHAAIAKAIRIDAAINLSFGFEIDVFDGRDLGLDRKSVV